MKNSIKILTTLGILFFMSFSIQAQIHDWTGKWETTLLGNNWEVNITKKSDGSYTGTFPNGTLVGKYQYGDIIGTYTRTNVKMDKTGMKMGKSGAFRFVMVNSQQQAFEGYYMPLGRDDWQAENWNGKRVTNRRPLSKKKGLK
ncbi:hypothetical protein [uncultured Maribacter sp.]|uniref:hypothetical protein n=1 Tax=uncultured Maribacter sp. TaxID=431308 RepID=UPI0030EC0881|tara:strand:- start:110702 stop:111130 length:429 start_codon:yes stop_codon:yes gene_type:complete